MIVINQMDRENANFSRALATITDKYGSHIAPIEVPIVEGGKFTGVVCVLENKAYTGEGKTLKEIDHPRQHGRRRRERPRSHHGSRGRRRGRADGKSTSRKASFPRKRSCTACARGIKDGTVVPVVCCSSLTRVALPSCWITSSTSCPPPAGSTLEGVNPKSGDAEERVCADDQPFSARVFKTLADPFVGKLSLLKVTSGTLPSGTPLYNANAEKAEKAGNIYFLRGGKQNPAQKCARATSAPFPSWAASPPATRCATRTSL